MAGRVHTSRRRTRSTSTYRKHSPSDIPPSQHIRANLRFRTAQPGRDRQSTQHSPFSYISQLRSSVHHVQIPDELRGAEEQQGEEAGRRAQEGRQSRSRRHQPSPTITIHRALPGCRSLPFVFIDAGLLQPAIKFALIHESTICLPDAEP